MAHASEPPVVQAKGYDLSKWLLARIESFPKNQRNAIGQRLTDRTRGSCGLAVRYQKRAISPSWPAAAGT